MVYMHPKRWREAFRLTLPVPHNGHGADDEGGLRAFNTIAIAVRPYAFSSRRVSGAAGAAPHGARLFGGAGRPGCLAAAALVAPGSRPVPVALSLPISIPFTLGDE